MMKNRKLFPALPPEGVCHGICEPACLYDCYAFTYSNADPPPPPPPSLPQTSFPPSLIIALPLLVIFSLFCCYYFITSTVRRSCCRRGRIQPRQQPSDDSDGLDHPIWYIATVGLQQSVIRSIAVCRYKVGEGLVEGTQCSVCLCEFRDGEALRLLPKCNHAFHLPCIDTWLRSHTNCPLCRARIMSTTVHESTRGENFGVRDRGSENSMACDQSSAQIPEVEDEVVCDGDVVKRCLSTDHLASSSRGKDGVGGTTINNVLTTSSCNDQISSGN